MHVQWEDHGIFCTTDVHIYLQSHMYMHERLVHFKKKNIQGKNTKIETTRII